MATNSAVNGQTVVHKDSDGIVTTSPDVCMTPVGTSVVPIPYTNVAKSVDTDNGSKTVTVDGNPVMLKGSFFSVSSGDEPGTAGGISSGITKGKAKFVNYSFDVFVEGKPVCRRLDPMVSNLNGAGNTPPAPLIQPNVQAEGKEADGHLLSIALVFEHPDVITRHVTQPLLNGSYTLCGPETYEGQRDESFVGFQHCVATAGVYSLEFPALDRQQKPLVQEKGI